MDSRLRGNDDVYFSKMAFEYQHSVGSNLKSDSKAIVIVAILA